MTHRDISSIEKSLKISLPADYVLFVTTYLAQYKFIQECLAREQITFISIPFDDPKEMIRENLDLGACLLEMGESFVEDGKSTSWSSDNLLIGTNGGGNYCYIKKNGLDRGVYWMEHESCELKRFHDSLFDAFAEDQAIFSEYFNLNGSNKTRKRRTTTRSGSKPKTPNPKPKRTSGN